MPNKELIVVAGPNGAGKSTFVNGFLAERGCPYLCADLIATEFKHLDPVSQQIAAGREFLRRANEQLSLHQVFIIETTMSGRTLANYLERARVVGFRITIMFVFLDSPDHCVVRVNQRVRRGGHNVPEEDIRRRFARSCANFWHTYREIADQWEMVYNSSSGFIEVAIGITDDFAVSDEELFRVFLELAEVELNG
jgi:predicted ABC-type ATPase